MRPSLVGLFIVSIASISEGADSEDAFILPMRASYSPLIRPNFKSDPVVVNVTMFISFIELKHNLMDAIGYLRSSWTDARLQNSGGTTITYKAEQVLEKIWTPDLFFPNLAEPLQIMNKGFVRISSAGDITTSQMFKGTFSCPGASLSFAILNKELIRCLIELESYGQSTNDLIVKLGEKNPFTVDKTAVNQDLYRAVNDTTLARNISLSIGNYSRVTFAIDFESNVKITPYAFMRLAENKWH